MSIDQSSSSVALALDSVAMTASPLPCVHGPARVLSVSWRLHAEKCQVSKSRLRFTSFLHPLCVTCSASLCLPGAHRPYLWRGKAGNAAWQSASRGLFRQPAGHCCAEYSSLGSSGGELSSSLPCVADEMQDPKTIFL